MSTSPPARCLPIACMPPSSVSSTTLSKSDNLFSLPLSLATLGPRQVQCSIPAAFQSALSCGDFEKTALVVSLNVVL